MDQKQNWDALKVLTGNLPKREDGPGLHLRPRRNERRRGGTGLVEMHPTPEDSLPAPLQGCRAHLGGCLHQ